MQPRSALSSTLTRIRDDDELVRFAEMLDRWRPGWHARAACRGMDPNQFFPQNIGYPTKPTLEALRTCEGCPVRDECREAGRCETVGIWGGISASSRNRERREQKRHRQTRDRQLVS